MLHVNTPMLCMQQLSHQKKGKKIEFLQIVQTKRGIFVLLDCGQTINGWVNVQILTGQGSTDQMINLKENNLDGYKDFLEISKK